MAISCLVATTSGSQREVQYAYRLGVRELAECWPVVSIHLPGSTHRHITPEGHAKLAASILPKVLAAIR